jgi:hypothetical protein
MTIDIINPRIDRTVFSPLSLRHAILEPLRYLFNRVAPPDLKYSSDPAETKILIGTKGDKNSEDKTQLKPRILLSGGTYSFNRAGLTDNMSEQLPFVETGGKIDSSNALMVRGACTLLIEAEEEGVVLLLTDMASNFLTWSAPHICATFGFKDFGFPLTVQNAEMDTEDTEKYQATIMIPWIYESRWRIKEDALLLKDFFLNISNS